MHDMDLENLREEWRDPGLLMGEFIRKQDFHDLDMREAGLGCQKNARRPLAETVHAGVPLRRYHAQAAPQQYRLQGGVFGHANAGFMDSVHTLRGGGRAEELTLIAKEETDFRDKLKGDCKYMMALLKQPAKLSQIDRFGMTSLKDAPKTHFGKTLLKAPEGIITPFPVSMLAGEKWSNPADTATVLKYGVSLQYKSGADESTMTCSFNDAKAVGVKVT